MSDQDERPRVLDDPGRAERLTILATGAGTGGARFAFDYLTLRRGGGPFIPHVHPHQEERFRVLSGAVLTTVAGRERRLEAGATAAVPPGVSHRFVNAADQPARVEIELVPALESERMFRELWAFSVTGHANRWGFPADPTVAILFAHRHLAHAAMPGIPVIVQRAGLGLIVPLLKALGAERRYARVLAEALERGSGEP